MCEKKESIKIKNNIRLLEYLKLRVLKLKYC